MHRFRKKSDANIKRPSALQIETGHLTTNDNVPYHELTQHISPSGVEGLPELPTASDFRASLILTDLSRRFTLLNHIEEKDTTSYDTLRSKLAEQRARGAKNQVSEEEEKMIIESLGWRPSGKAKAEEESLISGPGRSSVPGSPPMNKRYSNNLFGSGRFRDYSYVRSVQKQGSASSARASSSTTDSTAPKLQSSSHDSLGPLTPDNLDGISMHSAPIHPLGPYSGQAISVAEYRLSKALGPSVMRRASLAIEDAIQSIEEEAAEDEIVMPRTVPVPRLRRKSQESKPLVMGAFEGGVAISSDKHASLEPDSPRASPIPTRIIPGYIPGMPRPMTPTSTEFDEQRSYSTTPRASSPNTPRIVSPSPRRQSSVRSYSPAPIFLQRTLNGRFTPEDPELDASSIANRQRAGSPLSGTTFQPMSVAKRPGTPGGKPAGHTRDGSWVSDPGTDQYSRSLRSPALPDSPMIGPGHNTMHSFNSSLSTTSSFESPRPTSVVSGIDIGSPVIAPVDSRRSSKQNRPSSPFTLTPFQPLIFSPVANSSRSSLESVGSSYHSWNGDDKDRSTLFFADPEPQRGAWHDIALPSQLNSDGSNADDGEAEDMVLKYAGLKNIDFVAIQEKLVSAATKPPATAAEVRTPSLRRGRPSTSQSTYSLNGRIASPPQSPTTISPPSDGQMVYAAEPETPQDVSPTTRRHRDLTKALFGDGGEVGDESGVPGLVVSPSATSFLPPSPRDPPSSATWPHPLPRSPSTPRLPQTEEEHEELAREIQRKADAAMIMLHKQPSNSNLAVPPKGSTRKRINPHQISTPQLVSASTSVDTIPLPSPSLSGGQFKIGSRLKRLRGSLRTKTMPTAQDVTPFPPELQSPQAARYDPTKFRAPGPTVMSATEFEGFKVSAPLPPSPPASAGPGLKGFMARFRGRQRASDNPLDSHADLRPMYKSGPSSETLSSGHVPAASPDDGRAAIKQLFDAASNLGLDQTALNDLLVRSGSTSSRASEWSPLSRNASRTTSNEPARSHRTHPSIVAESPEPVVERKAEAERKESNAVVRRTIIFPSESRTSTIDISVLLRKHSSRRRRASSASVSSRSVHDRVPTPPPPKPQRFSNVPAPPLPSADKIASARDTYYDMHGNAADAASSQGGHGQSGPAVEVVELASGETIWKIVNGLRNDDDDLDAFNHRGSFASDYSLRDSGDGVQVFFKEHGRKGSGSSYFGRKKSITAKSGRPETKVFYSSSAQIGRLIENISEGMEAGSFNFLPTTPGPAASAKPAKFVPSTASSLVEPDWTLEETLDHMISSNMRR